MAGVENFWQVGRVNSDTDNELTIAHQGTPLLDELGHLVLCLGERVPDDANGVGQLP